jgi:methionyl aminopeptidase
MFLQNLTDIGQITSSFIIGKDIHGHQKLVDASKDILQKAIDQIKGGVKIADIDFDGN